VHVSGGGFVVGPIIICIVGVVFLGIGIAAAWPTLSRARGLEKLIALGLTFEAAALATFGTEHQFLARFIMQGVPAWMPARLFWAYFVGVALIAAALSLALNRCVKWSALLTGIMILLFVLTIHVPNAAANPHDRFIWTVVLRDLAFASGIAALAGSRWDWGWLVTLGRVIVAAVALFFAIEHFLHPTYAPGVPLQKMTPAWVPMPALWGYLVGTLLLAGGLALIANWRSRSAAGWLGLVMLVLTVALYLPILLMASGTGPLIEGINYVGDTLLYSGTLLVLAEALPNNAGPMRVQ
jgi:uncharacterized membrane protein